MRDYFRKVYESRYFWTHLAKVELKNKFRRSKLGMLWTFISPLCLTAIMSVVFATVFHADLVTYAPYVLSGILCWEVITGSFVGGSYVIVSNDAYIRQFNHPITIYTLKSAIVITISFLISLIALGLWEIFIDPLNILIGLFTLPLTLVYFFAIAWSGVTIAAFTCTKYRDYPQMAPLILQTCWYLSPVFFQEEMFASNHLLYVWFNINPITHFLKLIRNPFLHGTLPSLADYLISAAMAALLAMLAITINKKSARDIIFYI